MKAHLLGRLQLGPDVLLELLLPLLQPLLLLLERLQPRLDVVPPAAVGRAAVGGRRGGTHRQQGEEGKLKMGKVKDCTMQYLLMYAPHVNIHFSKKHSIVDNCEFRSFLPTTG